MGYASSNAEAAHDFETFRDNEELVIARDADLTMPCLMMVASVFQLIF